MEKQLEAHQHTHEEDSYYLDQLCMVTLSGAFGAICLALYFIKTNMLMRLLGPQFHLFVLISGITLVGLALLRAFSLWVQVGKEKHAHEHDHESCCDHDHAHDHDHTHTIGHAHVHHHHHHDHGAEDHDHSWAPWRYVVLLVPVIFFLLGLPSKGPQAMSTEAIFTPDVVTEALGLLSPGSLGWSQIVYVGYLEKDQVKGEITDFSFKDLSASVTAAANSPDPNVREEWKNKNVRVIGMFSPSTQSDREFRLVRFKLTCCVADAIQLDLPIISRDSVRNIKPSSWVRVTGRVEFRKNRLDRTVPVVVVAGSQAVQPWVEDPNPYN